MKFILLVLCIFWGSCCTQRTKNYPLFMQEAVKCMDARPDRALELLKYLEDSLPYFPEETQMYYHLLCIQAKDKQYITHTSDSLINRIVEFYERRDDADKKMMAYYYQGSVYRDMNDAPRALKAYQQAVDISTPDNELLPKVYSQMGNLFAYQGLYYESIEVNRKQMDFYIKQGKSNKISYALRDIGRMHGIKEENDSALFYYKKAYNTALADGDSARYYGMLSEYGGYLYSSSRNKEAKQILKFLEKNKYIRNKTHIYSILGYIYYDEQQWDSAYYYKRKVLIAGTIKNKYNSYISLSKLEERNGNNIEALQYLRKAIKLNDSIQKITQTEAVAKINSLYNYQHTEAENSRLILEHTKQDKHFLLTLLIFLAILLLGSCTTFFLIREKDKKISRAEEMRKQEEEKYHLSQEAIHDNEQKIAELDALLEKSKIENNHLQQELFEVQQRKLKARNEEIAQWNKEQKLHLLAFKQSDLYKEFIQASQDESINITPVKCPEKWMDIQDYIDTIYPDFTERLCKLCPSLSNTELHVCYLSKIGISPSGIGRILKLTRQAITNIRQRFVKRMQKVTEDIDNFDRFIEDF